MMASAITMGALGAVFTFAPAEMLAWSGSQARGVPVLIAQAAGALYVGFAVLNWMAKDVAIGGIYSRPVTVGNFAHFFILGATLLRLAFSTERTAFLLAVTGVYLVFAVCFGILLFASPSPTGKRSSSE
jgi:hypothetical protein